ncbi:inorganic phosphate transporter Pho88, partial [Flammula alnicola]
SQKEGNLVTTTVHSYNLAKTPKLLYSTYMSITMMAVMHIYFHFIQPLFIQSFIGLKNIYNVKPVTIYVLGKPATGELKHLFKTTSMFAATGPQTDTAAIAEVEKCSKKK